MSLTTSIQYNISSSLTSDRSVSTAIGTYSNSLKSAVSSADNIYTDASAVASGSTSYDFSGSLENAIGDPVIFGKINYIQLVNKSTTSAITAFGASTDIPVLTSAGSVMTINAGGRFNMHYPSGLDVTATTADTITIRGTGAVFELAVIGSDA